MVRMEHDGIAGTITVPAVSVKTYERSGWRVVKDDEPAKDETAAAKGRRRVKGDEG